MRVRVSSPRRDRTDHYAESIVKLPVPVNVSVSVNLLARPVLAKQVYERRKRLRLRLHRDSDSDSETGDCELRLASGSFKLAAQITGGRGRPSHWQLSAPGQSRSVLSPGRALTVTEGTQARHHAVGRLSRIWSSGSGLDCDLRSCCFSDNTTVPRQFL